MARIWREKVLVLSLLVYVLFLGTLWALYRTGSPTPLRITVFDQIARPQEEVELAAKFETDGPGFLNPDRKGLAARLRVEVDGEWQEIAGTTDSDGMLRVRFRAPEKVGSYRLAAEPRDAKSFLVRPSPIAAELFVIAPDAPILICDIDDTVTAGSGWKTIAGKRGPDPQPGAASELTRLARRYRIVFLTARDDSLFNRSREWLLHHGFPRAPVVGRDWSVTNIAQAASFKTAALEAWQQRFSQIRWGVGNSDGDRETYARCGIPHIILGDVGDVGDAGDEDSESPAGEGSFRARNWSEVAAIIRQAEKADH